MKEPVTPNSKNELVDEDSGGVVDSSVDSSGVTYTVDDAIEHIGFGKFQIKLLFIAGACFMADAMEMMILSFIGPVLKCQWNLSRSQEAAITIVVFIGMLFGASCWGIVSDRFGRRRAYLFVNLFTFVWGLISSFSPHLNLLLFFRCLVGFGVGGVHVAFTLFAEFCPRNNRSTALFLVQIFWACGSMVSSGLAMGIIDSLGWRVYLITSACPFVLLILILPWVPESPRFLLAKGKVFNATQVLQKAAFDNGRELPPGTLAQGSAAVDPDSAHQGRFWELLTPSIRSSTILLWLIWFACAFSYYGMVLMVTELFQAERNGARCLSYALTDASSTIAQSCVPLTRSDYLGVLTTTTAEFPGVLFTGILINWKPMGRKRTISLGFAIMGVTIFLLMPCTTRGWETFFMFIIRGAIAGGFQGVYVYTTEFYPTTVRSTGMGFASSVARVGGILTPYVAQVLTGISIYAALTIYSVVVGVASVCCLLLRVETLGWKMTQNLKEMELRLQRLDAESKASKSKKQTTVTLDEFPRDQTSIGVGGVGIDGLEIGDPRELQKSQW